LRLYTFADDADALEAYNSYVARLAQANNVRVLERG